MEPKRKSWMDLFNPFTWLAALLSPLLRFLGLLPPPRTDGFENISKADVDEAAEAAKTSEEAIDAIMRDMSPAEIVKAYASAAPEARAEMDLSVLDFDAQAWLLKLTDDELTLLAMSTTAGCARSLEAREVKPIFPKRTAAETATAEILRIPAEADEEERKRLEIMERFRQVRRELWLAPGVPNPQPRHIPRTLH
ncbi:hypothetical protein ACTJK5_10860 [Agrobacterium sp. 22094]|uniref:hypothetical protein n=1 Tax=Agrobacterium sp. 22094 TaxID=3453872 RepID=UPI003F84096D